MIQLLQRHWKWLAALTLAGLVVGLIKSWKMGDQLCAPSNRTVTLPTDLAVEPITFPSASGATIHGS